MQLVRYFKKIGLSDYIVSKVLPLIEANQSSYAKYLDNLVNVDTAEDEYLKIKQDFPDDEQSFIILSIYLLASIKTMKVYREKKISIKIFYETMKCITRFIKECKVMNGEEYFDRDFWVHKQISLNIFRIGELEYELLKNATISIHIPSDAVLTKENIESSLNQLKKFIARHYPQYNKQLIYCDSWLLSPNLKKFLKDDSNILTFQKFFDVKAINEDNNDFIGWLFQTKNIKDIDGFKETTSLQRQVKQALLNNEKIGSAYGVLKLNV